MRTIFAGELDRFLTIQEPSGTKDDYGHDVHDDWVNVHVNIPCGISIKKGGEVWESTQDVGNETTEFKIRFIEGITPRMRLIFEGEIYNIKRVEEITRRKGYVIIAQWKDNR
jgi:head-tail adaptor